MEMVALGVNIDADVQIELKKDFATCTCQEKNITEKICTSTDENCMGAIIPLDSNNEPSKNVYPKGWGQ